MPSWTSRLVLLLLPLAPLGSQPGILEEVVRFHETTLQPAGRALSAGRLTEAAGYIEAALREAERFPVEALVGMPSGFQLVARLATEKGMRAHAERLLRKAVSIWEATMGPNFQPLASVLTDLAQVARLEKRFPEAESLVRRALALRQQPEPYPEPYRDPDAWPSFHEQAMLHADQGRDAEAEAVFHKVVQFADKTSGWDQIPNFAPICDSYAQLLRRGGRVQEAARLESRARRIRANMAEASRQVEELRKRFPPPR